jgi:hypothetical protein
MTWLPKAFPSLEETENVLEPGGQDQMQLKVTGLDEVERFLQQEPVARAIREFNMRLMKKGASVYGRYHCLDLADVILAT